MSLLSLRTKSKLRILDFDLENRPLSYWGVEPTAQITAIATCWADDPKSMQTVLLGENTPEELLSTFLDRYNEADMVTGHNIRGHDLIILNGALMELGWPLLKSKLTQDTYLDLKKKKGIPASQEYFISLFNLGAKIHMTQNDWREANRLTPEGLEKTAKRVSGDVFDHMKLRPEMIRRKLLKPPRVWHP